MPELKDIALAKLSTREALIREIQAAVNAQLYSGKSKSRGRVLNGPLGEQIAIAAGSLNVTSFVTPEQIAEGICNWLDKYFFPNNGPREGHEDSPPPPCNGGGDGLRVASPGSSKHSSFAGVIQGQANQVGGLADDQIARSEPREETE